MTAPRSTFQKCVLLVERASGALVELASSLQGLGFEVVRASNTVAVAGLVKSLRRLSLVVVNGDTLKTNAVQLIGTIKTQHPDLPIAWFTTDPSSLRTLPKKPDFCSSDVRALEERIARALQQEFYPPQFIEQTIALVQKILSDLALPAKASEPQVKSQITPLNAINAFLFFTGDKLSGHLLLSASVTDLAEIYRAKFSGVRFPGDDDLEDLLGEVANQIVGEIRRTVESEASDCRIGLPHFIRGTGASFRHKAGAPSLVAEFSEGEQKLQFEICLYRFERNRLRPAGDESHVKAGVFNLL